MVPLLSSSFLSVIFLLAHLVVSSSSPPPHLLLLGDLPAGHRVRQRGRRQRPALLRQPLRQRQQHLPAELEEAEADPATGTFQAAGSGSQGIQFLH